MASARLLRGSMNAEDLDRRSFRFCFSTGSKGFRAKLIRDIGTRSEKKTRNLGSSLPTRCSRNRGRNNGLTRFSFVGDVPSGRINLFVRPRLERMVGSFGIHAYERFGNSEVQMSK